MTKECLRCHLTKDLSEFYPLKKGLFGRASKCKTCASIENKTYRNKPGMREKHTEAAREWREKNREKVREINRRCADKNKDRINATRREKYKTDPTYRAKRRAADIRYKESGRRNEMNRLNPKHRQRAKAWAKEHPDQILKKAREYRKKKWNGVEKEQREKLDTAYIVKILKRQTGHRLKTAEIPKDLIEIKRKALELKRQLNKNKNDN